MMSHEGYETVICGECEKVITQCLRDEITRYIVCADCLDDPDHLDQLSRAAQVAAASLIDLVSVIELAFVKPKAPVKENENARD